MARHPVAADPKRAIGTPGITVRRTVSGTTVQPGLVSWCRRMPSAHASHPGRGASGEGRACHRWNPGMPPRESPTRTRPTSSDSATGADAWAGRSSMTRCAPSRHAACSAGSGLRISRRTGSDSVSSTCRRWPRMSSGIIAEEQALRRPMTVVITPLEPVVEDIQPAVADGAAEPRERGERPVRFAAVPAGA